MPANLKVCIDPGHGMGNRSTGVFDPGCTHREGGTLFREADIVLKYGLALKDILRARGVDVFMIRDDHSDPAPVARRAKMAKDAGCAKYVSIHVNAAEVEQANGIETLYNKDSNLAFAKKVQKALVKATGLRDRGTPNRPELAVLKVAGPAVLVELGFIANDKDRETFLDPVIREKICVAIADSL
jgi:N-acetylmuramoyl-L-alanine amidase